MTVEVLLFASYADVFESPRLAVTVLPGATVGDVLAEVIRRASRALPPRPLMARNSEYASLTEVVAPGDEIAILPPVAGG